MHALHRRDVLARARRRLELKAHRLLALGRFDALDLVELLDPALHLRGMAGARLESFDEGHLLCQHRLLTFELRLLLHLRDGTLLAIKLVVPRIGRQSAGIDLDDLVDDAVHEFTVVRRHQNSAVETLEEGLKPDQAFDIEMVRRFVEEHDVGAHQEDLRQRHAHLPAARQLADIAVHHRLAEAEAVKHFAGAPVQRIAVEFVIATLNFAVAGDDLVHLVGAVWIGHSCFQLCHLGCQRADRSNAVDHFDHCAAPRHVAHILAEIADRHATIDGDLALIRQFLTGDHAKQRRLARTVWANKTDLLSALECRRRLDEDDLFAVLLADAFEADHAGIPGRREEGAASDHPTRCRARGGVQHVQFCPRSFLQTYRANRRRTKLAGFNHLVQKFRLDDYGNMRLVSSSKEPRIGEKRLFLGKVGVKICAVC